MFRLVKSVKKVISAVAVIGIVLAMVSVPSYPVYAAQAAVNLLTAGNFAVLAGAGITNTGATTITGDVGTFPTTSETGCGPAGADRLILTGTNHAGDSVTQTAKNDLVTAYDDAASRTPVITVPTELGTHTYGPGVYNSAAGTFQITGTLTLDAGGDPNAVFIFKAASTLITASSSIVNLAGSAQACNVFWQVASSATLGSSSTFIGNILALTSISLGTGANVTGRVLARNGAVTMITDTISKSVCSGGTTPALVTNSNPTVGATTAHLCMNYDFGTPGTGTVWFTYQKQTGGTVITTTAVTPSPLPSGTYCLDVSGLSQGTPYYFQAHMLAGGTTYDASQKSFNTGMSVGGEVSAVNKAWLLAPWLGLGLILVLGVAFLLLRRRASR